jgi:hypothetical protein
MEWAAGSFPVVAAVLWWAIRRAIDQQISPLRDELRVHMTREAADAAELRVALEHVAGQFRLNDVEHAAFHERLRRVETRP